jgi:hypothetical protein
LPHVFARACRLGAQHDPTTGSRRGSEKCGALGSRHVLRPPERVRAPVALLEERMISTVANILVLILLIIVIVWAAQFLLGYG